ncbi:hypothetical protein GIB67_008865 [Kingdonia uniflora]|uniref:Transmembrane protein n=1 Tax=Kingdonia uniflora TaxID=39325 RepID=A0A7J7LVH2_9MAGN|nr:hypothetical protein GIB67_008865 [Kingdonia uniflora]
MKRKRSVKENIWKVEKPKELEKKRMEMEKFGARENVEGYNRYGEKKLRLTLFQVSAMPFRIYLVATIVLMVADVKKMNGLVTDLQMFALKSLRIPLPGRHPLSPNLSNGSATSSNLITHLRILFLN